MSPEAVARTSAERLRRWLRPGGAGRLVVSLAMVLAGMACCGRMAARAAGPDDLARSRYDAALRRAARRHLPPGWDWRLLKAMAYQESRLDPAARSASGAVGLCQVMPATASELGVPAAALADPWVNIEVGARLLRRFWDQAEGLSDGPPVWSRSRAAVAAYHAGATGAGLVGTAGCRGVRRRSWRGLRRGLPEETRRHVEAVFDTAWPRLRRVHPAGARRRRP